MAMSVSCPNCGSKLSVRESLAGQSVGCPKCKTRLNIPQPMEFESAPEQTDQEPNPTTDLIGIAWYFCNVEGGVSGPIASEKLRQFIAKGMLDRTDLVWNDGLVEWTPAGAIKGLFKTPPPLKARDNAPDIDESYQDNQEELRPKEYKVLSLKDKWFSGKFDPALLEQALNAYSQQGWTLRAAVTASIAGFGGNREEMLMILER